MSEVLKICGIALITVTLSAFLKGLGSSIAVYLPQISSIILFIFAITAAVPIINLIKELISGVKTDGTPLTTLVIAGGMAVISKIISDLCKENGHEMLKNAVEFAVNTEILLLCIPLIKDLLVLSSEVLGL